MKDDLHGKLSAMFAEAKETATRVESLVDFAVHGGVTDAITLIHRDLANLRGVVAAALGHEEPAAEETAG